MITAAALIKEARALIGTPWRHEGRGGCGVDCIGLVIVAGRNAGVDFFQQIGIPPIGVYGRKPDKQLIDLVETHCTPAAPNVPGSLLLFKFRGDAYPRHFAILTERQTIIHAELKLRQRVIEHGYRAQWPKWTHSRWLLPGVTYV